MDNEEVKLDIDGSDSFHREEVAEDGSTASFDQLREELPQLDGWLCDLSPHRRDRESSGYFIFSPFMLTGFIWGIVDASSGDVLALFQHAGGYLSRVGHVERFPAVSRLLTEPLEFGVLVLTESGVNTFLPEIGGLENFEVPPTWPPKVKAMDLNSIFKSGG